MLRLFVLAAQVPVVLLALYNAVVALWGWSNRSAVRPRAGSRNVRVVVPAHDEELVIGSLMEDLSVQDYPAGLLDVVVIADRCTDRTADAVHPPARVAERVTGTGGKGGAIAWHLEHEPLEPSDVLVILDADNRVDEGLIASVVAAVDAGSDVVQCYLDVANPDASPLATASALSYWASNRMVQLARENLGWACDLGGTGMAMTAEALQEAGGFTDDLVEDQALGVRLALAGHPAHWEHRTRIRDEKPTEAAIAVTQRARWMAGRRALARRYSVELLRTAVRTRSLGFFDLWLRLVQPSRMFMVLVAAVLGLTALITSSPWVLSWPLWLTVVVVAVAMPIPFLLRDGVAGRYVVRYPLLIALAALWVPVRVASSLVGDRWRPTPHTGESDGSR